MSGKRGVSELEAIELLAARFSSPGRSVRLGIGDDAAVLDVAGSIAWTIDDCVEGVHFERALLSLEDVGYRSFAAAVSDLGAMGAAPLAALSALVLPRGLSRRELDALGRGQAEAARELGCPVVGGNIARGPGLAITTTAIGRVDAALTRDGAHAGDELWLVGDVGLARAGLLLLQRFGGRRPRGLGRDAFDACVSAWRRPRALVRRGRGLVGRATACLDVSDGLGGDAGHLARASGVRVVVEEAALARTLRSELVRAAESLGATALSVAVTGGEDYALLATGPKQKRPRWARRIGRVVHGSGARLERDDGKLVALESGFDHLR